MYSVFVRWTRDEDWEWSGGYIPGSAYDSAAWGRRVMVWLCYKLAGHADLAVMTRQAPPGEGWEPWPELDTTGRKA